MRHTLLICRCGRLRVPALGGVRGGRTPNLEIADFLAALSVIEPLLPSAARCATIRQQCESESVTQPRWLQLLQAVEGAERSAGRALARLKTRLKRRSPQGRFWQPPERPCRGFRAQLQSELEKCGCDFDEARVVVKAMIEAMTAALQRGDAVETPLGTFRVKQRPPAKPCWRLGKWRPSYGQRKTVVFEPAAALCIRPQTSVDEEKPMKKQPMSCPRCGSEWCYEVEFKRYLADTYSSSFGGELRSVAGAFTGWVCLCGEPLRDRPEIQRIGDLARSFQDSWSKAVTHRDRLQPEQVLRALSAELVSQAELAKVQERLKHLEGIGHVLKMDGPDGGDPENGG
jgi:nucleoid DNA-binding protein